NVHLHCQSPNQILLVNKVSILLTSRKILKLLKSKYLYIYIYIILYMFQRNLRGYISPYIHKYFRGMSSLYDTLDPEKYDPEYISFITDMKNKNCLDDLAGY